MSGEESVYADRFRLEGRRIVVLGAGLGMGREAAVAAHQLGASVFSVDLDGARATSTAELVGGGSASVDVTDRDAVLALADQASEALGGIDGVVDVVGMAAWHAADQTPAEVRDRMFALNYVQALHVLEAFTPKLTDGGTFAFVSSVSGVRGAQGHSAYGSAKAALIALVRSAAVELAPRGIRVNAVAPGVILTPRTQDSLFADPEFVAAQEANVPMGRFGDTRDIAGALMFFTTAASAYVTGQNLIVDGGVDAKFPHLIKS
ncbi:SDR family NAD(P)-dependent oxidoreductase [Agromyces aerolatus]|uniref:SDR family NAD(P)-dependent oxidoreductase n=1 Tax=Agromyces sp. LY-1074 TaxID=3074080 RepID=UPI00286599F4|nr:MULTISPECIES: SDR family oxidoreductase [unclassified Agromyces]MDR5701615.1 SDR family oxidoreductase [Agromyces sp. LY-1074]MDR5706145.1 SDR family oxidoreductase [Agromyces sp. LY-1358]